MAADVMERTVALLDGAVTRKAGGVEVRNARASLSPVR